MESSGRRWIHARDELPARPPSASSAVYDSLGCGPTRTAMHIPDAYLSPTTQAIALAAMAPVWFVAARRTRRELTTKQAPLLSMGAAFCFAVQMFNIPAVGGTTAHALGAALLAILVGPWAAVLGLTLTLAIQALLFGDGG